MMDFLTPLSQYGLLGLLLAIALFVIGYQEREKNKLREKIDNINETRILDAHEFQDKVTQPLIGMKAAMDTMNTTMSAVLDLVKRNNNV